MERDEPSEFSIFYPKYLIEGRYTFSMLILPVRTKRLQAGDDLSKIISESIELKKGDILVISSKTIATTEGAAIKLSNVQISPEAIELSKKCDQDSHFTQAVLNEMNRLNGTIVGTCPHCVLTSLKPKGMTIGTILCPNAGLDQSNIEIDYAIGWPKDPVLSAKNMRMKLDCPIIISDSNCRPGRLGVTAFALVCCGIDPMKSEIGSKDLFGKPMHLTEEAVADQLATAANFVMGNAGQSIPAALIRDHEIPSSDFCGWVEGIKPDEDLFRSMW